MDTKEISSFLEKNSVAIHKIVNIISSKNREYSHKEIYNMVVTELWATTNPSKREIYLRVLNRILDEKGFKYSKNALIKPIITVEDNNIIENSGCIAESNIYTTELLEEIFVKAKLTQEEIFVLSLSYGLSTPKCLKGRYKEILDNIEDVYYIRILTKKEVSNIMEMSVREMEKKKKTALEKVEKYCGLKKLYRTGEYNK